MTDNVITSCCALLIGLWQEYLLCMRDDRVLICCCGVRVQVSPLCDCRPPASHGCRHIERHGPWHLQHSVILSSYHHPHLTSRTWYHGKSCPARYGQSILLLLKTTRVETRVETRVDTVDPPEPSILPQSPPHYHTDNQLPRAGQGWTRH